MQFNVKFNPVPPAAGKTFWKLQGTLTPSSGGTLKGEVMAAAVQSTAQLQEDGSYLVPMTIDNVPVGNYTLVVEALDTFGARMGSAYTTTGSVPLNQGVWFPQPNGVA